MKKFILGLAVVLISTFSLSAQKIAVVDINAVLESMDDYQAAQAELDKVAAQWRQDVAKEYDKIKSMYNRYQAEQVLLSDEQKIAKEEEIVSKEKEVRDLQKRRFGPEGDLFKKRQELISPVQDQVYFAIEDFASDRGYDLILDKNGAAGILFASDDFDKTEDIMKRIR
jgi:outer membrane protein